jgi:FAD/FMN-containing dehydrogenase
MTSSGAAAAAQKLQVLLPGRVVTPEATKEFQAAVKKPWSQTCWTPAAAYIHLHSAEEIAQALAVIKETKSKFAIRSAGHNPNAGFASTDETGVVLDISAINSRELLNGTGPGSEAIARVGAGATWGELYTWLEGEHALSVSGGRDLGVGLGGFLLNGRSAQQVNFDDYGLELILRRRPGSISQSPWVGSRRGEGSPSEQDSQSCARL